MLLPYLLSSIRSGFMTISTGVGFEPATKSKLLALPRRLKDLFHFELRFK